MKKIIFLLLTGLLSVLCAEDTVVLCTTTPVTAFSRAVLKDVKGFRVEQLLPEKMGCPHDYSLTPHEVNRIIKARIIVKNGLGMEAFLDPVLKRLHSKAVVIDASSGVKGILASEPHDAHEGHHGEKKHVHSHHVNEHLFAAPSSAAEVVDSLVRSFSKISPGNASAIRKNGKVYADSLRKIAADYSALAEKIPSARKNVAVQHSIFGYLARETGLHVSVCLQEHSGQEPSPAQIRHLIQEIRKDKVAFILAENRAPSNVTKLISRESGVPVIYLDVNPDNAEPETILSRFKENFSKLEKAFLKK